MELKTLTLENFGSHENTTINLEKQGLVLIEGINYDQGGSNGSGKSTIADAICWVLFGRTVRDHLGTNTIRHSTRSSRVGIQLVVDGRSVEISRERSGTNTLSLLINNQDCRGATYKETQTKILTLLQLDWESFTSAVFFPQGQSGIASWVDSKQKSVLDTILGLQKYARAQERAKELKEDLKAEITRFSTRKSNLEFFIQKHHETLTNLHARSEQWERDSEAYLSTIKQKIEQLESSKPSPPEDFQEYLDKLYVELDQTRQTDLINVEQQCYAKLMELREKQSELTGKKSGVNYQLTSIEILDPDKELAKASNCPECGQLLPEEARAHFHKMLCEKNDASRSLQDRLKNDLSVMDQKLSQWDAELTETQNLLNQTQEALSTTREIEKKVETARSAVHKAWADLERWETQRKHLKQDLETKVLEKNPFLSTIEEEQKKGLTAQEDLEKIESQVAPLNEEMRYVEWWINGFGNRGVKSLLLSTVTPFLNERANVYLKELTQGSAHIKISTQTTLKTGALREKLDFKVSYGATDKYTDKSGGEQRRADLAILFALGDLARNRAKAPVSLSVLDEPFESLDSLGCEQVMKLLNKHILPKVKTIFVISHSESMKSLFEKRLIVMKKNGISTVRSE